MKKQRHARVRVEKGYGPRHAFNAQEGSEAVPDDYGPGWSLQRALHSAGEKIPPALKAVAKDIQSGILSDESIAEIKKNPASLDSLGAYLGAGIALSRGAGGKSPGELPRGAVKSDVFWGWKPSPGAEARGGLVRTDGSGNHYEYIGSHSVEGGDTHAIVKPVEGPNVRGMLRGKEGYEEAGGEWAHPELSAAEDPDFQAKYGKPPPEEPPQDLALLSPHEASKHVGETQGTMSDLMDALKQQYAHMQRAQENGTPINAEAAKYHADSTQNWKSVADQLEELGWTKQGEHYVPPSTGGQPPSEEPPPGRGPLKDIYDLLNPPGDEPPLDTNVPRYRKGKAKIAVAKGFGPRHAENAKEGDLTQQNTDTVPAMLTPREAVLNRNAAELAGRGNIEQLNQEGNVLAKKGVDLAAKGQASVPNVKVPIPRVRGSGNVLKYVLPGELRREAAVGLPKLRKGTENMNKKQSKPKPEGYARGRAQIGGSGGGFNPAADVGGYYGNKAQQPMPPGFGDVSNDPGRPVPIPMGSPTPAQRDIRPVAGPGIGVTPYSTSGGGGFYPPGQGFNKPYGMAEGASEVPGGIGVPNPSKAYDPREQVDFKAPDLNGFLQAIHAEAKKQGISTGQMSQIAQQIAGGFGGGGGALGANYAAAGSPTPVYGASGYPSAIPVGGYQGGISDIGYPPFAAPNAVYHGDKGSNWIGEYDPAIMIPRYQGGTSGVPPPRSFTEPGSSPGIPGLQGGDSDYYGNRRFGGGGERFNYDKLLSGGYPGPNFNNPNDPANAPDLPPIRGSMTPQLDQFDTQTANYYRGLQGGFGGFGYQPNEGTPGFLQGSTRHMGAFDAQGYPYAQPVNSSDNPRPMPHWRPKSRS